MIAAIMQQIIFLAMALVFSRDFEYSYFRNLIQESKFSIYHITVKSFPFLLMISIMWAIVGLFIPYFQIDADVFNFPMLILVSLLTLASMFIGMLFSIAIPSQLKATELLMVISTPAFVLSGFTWPSLAFPDAISSVALFIPLTQFLSAFRKIAFYGGDISSIAPEINILVIIIFVTFITILLLLQLKIYRYRKNPKNSLMTAQD
ncbi:ABC transporter permease [Gillisia sp. JM1]|uniref:ABC transporter permease n=1 Tax=Gillisia sp. JM1 TaxID=1283286 RepID=UPI001E366253|nr:ABC transporter permease [Gillisia sp. JM1]